MGSGVVACRVGLDLNRGQVSVSLLTCVCFQGRVRSTYSSCSSSWLALAAYRRLTRTRHSCGSCDNDTTAATKRSFVRQSDNLGIRVRTVVDVSMNPHLTPRKPSSSDPLTIEHLSPKTTPTLTLSDIACISPRPSLLSLYAPMLCRLNEYPRNTCGLPLCHCSCGY